jgi:hypothetical protein
MASKFSLCNMTRGELGLAVGGRTERVHLPAWRYDAVSLLVDTAARNNSLPSFQKRMTDLA